MRERLYWIAFGGICFWLPSVVSVVLGPHLHNELWTFVILPLAGFAFLCAGSWIASRREPKWAWILAGIYILGSIVNLALPAVFRSPLSLFVPGKMTWAMILVGLLPPVYFRMALLIVTPVLVAMCFRPKRVID